MKSDTEYWNHQSNRSLLRRRYDSDEWNENHEVFRRNLEKKNIKINQSKTKM